MFALCASLLLGSITTSFADDDAKSKPPAAGMQLSYSGSLAPADDGNAKSARNFRIHFIVTEITASGAARVAWVLEDLAGAPRLEWPQRLGTLALDKSLRPTSERDAPAIVGERDGMTRVIPLRLPFYATGREFEVGAEWNEGSVHYEVAGRDPVAGRKAWRVIARSNLGTQEVAWIDGEQGTVLKSQQLVNLGQGVPHELAIELEKSETLSAEALAAAAKAHGKLVALRGPQRDRPVDVAPPTAPASPQLLEQARAAQIEIDAAVKTGPIAELAKQIVREAQSALDRDKNLAKLAAQTVGKKAKDFSLATARGAKVSLADFKGKPVVLHFWEYRSEPKVAPYGETGYLDFLWRQREKQGVVVLGVAVDPRLAEEGTRAAARKDIRSFCDFMNLSFPVAFDDGGVLQAFGDPRDIGGKLPLYVVIAPDGTVSDFHAGFWGASADEGLKELDQRLLKMLPSK